VDQQLSVPIGVGTPRRLTTLLGSRDMPGIDTSFYDPNLDVIALLEIRFDIELEGWADIFFNSPNTDPGGSNAVVLRTLSWPLVPP
jgi:hypothetical protein